MTGARRTIEDMRGQPEADWDVIRHTVIVYVLFPNTVFIVQGDHIETWHVFPVPANPTAASCGFRSTRRNPR